MVENIECNGCKWNAYPICNGTILPNGNAMFITNLNESFKCGVKNKDNPVNNSENPPISEIELLQQKIDSLELRIITLEQNLQ